MQKRANAVTFKGKPLTVIGPQLKAGDSAPNFTCVTSGLEPCSLSNLPAKTRLFSVVPSLDTPVCHDQTVKFDEFSRLKHVAALLSRWDLGHQPPR